MPFTTPIHLAVPLREDNDNPVWKTLEPLNFRSERYQRHYVVPLDWETDLASVPRLPFVYLLAGGTATAPAVVHDFLYSCPRLRQSRSREEADAVFYEAMLSVGVSRWRAWLMYQAVRVCGSKFYRE